MELRVKVYGTLAQYVPAYDPETGMGLELPDNADAAYLMDYLGIPKSKVGMVTVNGKPVAAGEPFSDRAVVKIFQPIFGG
jgi:sulfur carrier protein ThiS